MTQNTRSCGSCNACCLTHEVLEIDKAPGVWCAACVRKRGCSVYAHKPKECGDFVCEWLKGFGKRTDRPDRTGVVLDYVSGPGTLPGGILQMFEAQAGSLEKPFCKELTCRVYLRGIFVSHIYLSGRKKMFVPSRSALTPEVREALQAHNFEISLLHTVWAD